MKELLFNEKAYLVFAVISLICGTVAITDLMFNLKVPHHWFFSLMLNLGFLWSVIFSAYKLPVRDIKKGMDE